MEFVEVYKNTCEGCKKARWVGVYKDWHVCRECYEKMKRNEQQQAAKRG
jgi:hypothetical protein